MNSTATKGFFKLCLTTLVAVYFLIAVGGIVRATGSGMGCPDWPKCFGQWIPPTSVGQLPENYKESYASYREKKNVKFAKYLRLVGMNETADKIEADKSILIEADFNPVNTQIEYLNRVVGVIVGLLIVALFYRSVKFRKTQPLIFWVSLMILLAVIFQGWFGSIVVSTNLTGWTITIHMFIALLIVGFLVYLLYASGKEVEASHPVKGLKTLLIACMAILLTQVFFGTQVREAIDRMVQLPRESWIAGLGMEFFLHRSFTWIVVLVHCALVWQLIKTTCDKALSRALILLILGSTLSGVGMAYFSVPGFLQPIHLLLATVAFGIQLFLFLRMNRSKKVVLI